MKACLLPLGLAGFRLLLVVAGLRRRAVAVVVRRCAGVRPYLKENVMSVIEVHAEVFSISSKFVGRVIGRVTEAVVEEMNRLIRCVTEFGVNGPLQVPLRRVHTVLSSDVGCVVLHCVSLRFLPRVLHYVSMHCMSLQLLLHCVSLQFLLRTAALCPAAVFPAESR